MLLLLIIYSSKGCDVSLNVPLQVSAFPFSTVVKNRLQMKILENQSCSTLTLSKSQRRRSQAFHPPTYHLSFSFSSKQKKRPSLLLHLLPYRSSLQAFLNFFFLNSASYLSPYNQPPKKPRRINVYTLQKVGIEILSFPDFRNNEE